MVSLKDIYWLAGLLEGEGCFHIRTKHNPIIQLAMTDLDVMIHAAQILGAYKVVKCKQDTRGGKRLYRLNVYGRRAIGWMLTLFSLLGERRQAKIKECVKSCMDKPNKTLPDRKPYSWGAEIVWQSGELT